MGNGVRVSTCESIIETIPNVHGMNLIYDVSILLQSKLTLSHRQQSRCLDIYGGPGDLIIPYSARAVLCLICLDESFIVLIATTYPLLAAL
jgi:hypothetical protein